MKALIDKKKIAKHLFRQWIKDVVRFSWELEKYSELKNVSNHFYLKRKYRNAWILRANLLFLSKHNLVQSCVLSSSVQFSAFQSLSCVRLFAIPWIAARQASLSITNSRSSHTLAYIKSVMPSSHLILGRPLLLLPPIPPSIRVFSNEANLRMKWPKYWSFSFSISPLNEHPGLISFRMDLLDLLAVQGTIKSLLQHHSSKASILWCSAFFAVQLSHPYMTTRKTRALTRRTFVGFWIFYLGWS